MVNKMFILIIFISISNYMYSESVPNYNSGNGTIIFQNDTKDVIETIRKCNVDITIGDLAKENERIIYNDYTSKNTIGELQDNDKIKVREIYRIEYKNEPKDKWDGVRGELWYKIEYNSSVGWICIISDYIYKYSDPYENNCWEIVEQIQSSGKKWTVRTIDQKLAVWENLNIRDNPGVTGNKIIYTIRPNDTDPVQSNVDVIAMTEETETIDGRNDHWLKIEYKDYVGWIFGGYTTAERGGPKYYIPENRVQFELGWY